MSADTPTPPQVAEAAAFVREVLPKPWSPGGLGPDAYHCWGLTCAAQRRLGGRDLPIINADPADLRNVIRLVADHPLKQEWVEVAKPRHLDVVTMAHHKRGSHIGTWLALDGGGVLHATQPQDGPGQLSPAKPGVSFDSLVQLKMMGFAHVKFFRHRDDMS